MLRKLSLLKIQFVADLELPLNVSQHPAKALVHTPSYILTSVTDKVKGVLIIILLLSDHL